MVAELSLAERALAERAALPEWRRFPCLWCLLSVPKPAIGASRAIGSFRDSADNKVNVGLTFRGDGNRGGCFAIDRGWRHRLARCNKRGKPKQIKM